jgi:raw score 4.87|nr:MAG TPA: tail tape measure [Caudoviricetes sp.]
MATNIGPKIGIDGEKQFRSELNSIGQQLRTLNTEMKAVTTAFDANDSSQKKLAAQSDVLTRQLSLQEQQVTDIQKALDYAKSNYAENSNEVQRWQQALNNATADMNKTKAAIKDLGDESGKSGKKVSTFTEVLKANLLSTAIVKGVKTITGAVKNMASEFVESAADVKAETAAFEQTFGNFAGTATAAIGRVADSSGILQTRLNTLGSKIYAFARSSGGDVEQSMSLMERALQAAADSAAYYDTSVEQATESLQSFLKGNYANDAALGLSATEATRNAAAMKLFGDEFKNLTEIQKQETLLQMVLDSQKLSGAMGQAAREADGWENVLGNLSETWRQFQANVGAPVLENLVPIIQNITTALQGWINGVDWDAFTSDFNSFVNAVMENGDTIISIIAGIGAGFLAWNVTSIINGVIASVTALGGILPAISAGIKAINVAMKANVIGIVVTAIAALVTWLVTLYNTNDEFREKVNAAWAAVKTVVLNAVAAFENAVDKFFDKVVEIGNSVVSFFKSVPEQMVEIGKNIVRGLWEGIKAMASWIGEKVSGFVGGLVDGVKGVLGIHSPSRVFAGIGQNMALGLGQGFKKQMQSVTAGIQDAIPTPTVDTVYNAAAGMVNGLAAQSAGSPGGSYTINLILQNGQQIASWLLPDLRDAARSNPEVATA